MRGIFTYYGKMGVLAFLIWMASGWMADAANVEVSSRLSRETTTVGTPVQLQITVQGARSADVPRDLVMEGLQTQYVGESIQVHMLNFQVSTSSSYTFVILPQRAGNFVIPELDVKVNGKTFRTQQLHLKVADSQSSWGSSFSGSQKAVPHAPSILPPVSSGTPVSNSVDSHLDQLAFGVLMIPKKKIYVGEVVPVEIRYYFHPDLSLQSVHSMPSLIGDNFVVQKIPEPQEGQEEVKGIKYMVVSFRSSIRPLKVGELQLPSTSISCQILTQARPEIPMGMLTDTFFQRFLDAMPGITHVKRIDVESEPVTVQVIPLPEENQPSSFHGAIGNFSLNTEVFPKDPSPGDPLTLRAIVSGEGNFGQLTAPQLLSQQGWQTYPPASKFTASDPIEYAGEKTFEWMLVPKENKTATPQLEFSYFDPHLNQYVTLHGESQPVHAVALSQGMPTPGVTHPSPEPISAEIGRWKVGRSLNPQSFQPLIARWEFMIANGVALMGLFTFLGMQLVRYSTSSDRGTRAALRRSLAVCRAQAFVSEGKEFYSAVVACLRLRAAISRGDGDGRGYSGEEVVTAMRLQGEKANLVLEVFSRYEELTYGAHSLQYPLSAAKRAAILQLLKEK